MRDLKYIEDMPDAFTKKIGYNLAKNCGICKNVEFSNSYPQRPSVFCKKYLCWVSEYYVCKAYL